MTTLRAEARRGGGVLGRGLRFRQLLAVSVVAVLALFLGSTAAGAQNGDWRLPGLDGGRLTQSDVARGATVVVLWAGWSPRCRDIVDKVNGIVDGWGGKAKIVTVDFQEEKADVERFLKGKRLQAKVYLDEDGAFAKRHRVSTLPGLVIYVDGAVVYRGKLPENPDDILTEHLQ